MTHITFIWGFMCVTQGKTRSEVRRLYSASSGHSRSVRISRTCSFSFSGTCAKVFLPLTIKVAYTTATSFTPFTSRIRIFSKRSSKQFLDLGTQFFRNLINGFQSFPDQFGIDFRHIRSPPSYCSISSYTSQSASCVSVICVSRDAFTSAMCRMYSSLSY